MKVRTYAVCCWMCFAAHAFMRVLTAVPCSLLGTRLSLARCVIEGRVMMYVCVYLS